MNVSKLSSVAGLAAGVAVTAALRFSPKWNEPILDGGKPVDGIRGASRMGEHDLRRRHRPVLGPKITARAHRLRPGLLRELVAGFGAGATIAPGATYRIESKLEDRWKFVASITTEPAEPSEQAKAADQTEPRSNA